MIAPRLVALAGGVVLGGAATLAVTLAPAATAASSRPRPPTSFRAVTAPTGTYLTWHGTSGSGFDIEQATNRSFTQGVRTYRTRGPLTTFTPTGLADGTTYYFRVSGVNGAKKSAASQILSTTVRTRQSRLRVLTYNSLAASFDGQRHPGGVSAPFAKRRAGQLALLTRSNAEVMGIEEGSSCLVHYKGKPCRLQIQSLAAGLTGYRLDDTDASATGPDRYSGNYILYNPNAVSPVGTGGHWLIGPKRLERFAAYQVFRITQTGATFLFVDTHLMATAGSAGDQVRNAETQSMLRQATAYAHRAGVKPILYVGDFNSYRNEWHVHDLTGKDMRAADIPDGIDVARTRTNAQYDSVNALYRTAKKGHGSFDHIYASPGIGVLSWAELLNLHKGKFVGTIPSDHNPVVSSVEIPY